MKLTAVANKLVSDVDVLELFTVRQCKLVKVAYRMVFTLLADSSTHSAQSPKCQLRVAQVDVNQDVVWSLRGVWKEKVRLS